MNTTRVGDEFELEVFDILAHELKQGNLLFNPQHSKIYHKKRYFSVKRNKDIIFDICIETYIPGQSTCSIRTIIECKNLSRPVEVAEIEEFYGKVTQVADLNVKGIFVSSSSFQESALNFAKASGIALLRILPGKDLKWVLTRALSGPLTSGRARAIDSIIYRALTDETYFHDYINLFGIANDQLTHSLWEIFSELTGKINFEKFSTSILLQPKNKNSLHVEFMDARQISISCRPILQDMNYTGYETPIYELVAKLERLGEIKLIRSDSLGIDRAGYEIKGGISFNPTTIYLASHASTNMHSQKFTLAHELGHYILKHDRYLTREFFSSKDHEGIALNENYPEDLQRMEWQANKFASHLLLPRNKLRELFFNITYSLDIRDRGHGALFVDGQRENLRNFFTVMNTIRNEFKVSAQAIEIALKGMDLINDQRKKPERASVPVGRALSSLVSSYGSR